MTEFVLNVEVRERTGTSGSREVRNAGNIPAVIYGGTESPITVAVNANEFKKALYAGKIVGKTIAVELAGKTQKVVAHEIQFHPVTDVPEHIDFMRA